MPGRGFRRDRRVDRAEEQGYKVEENVDEKVVDRRYRPATIQSQEYMLETYKSWREMYCPSAPAIEKGVPAPDLNVLYNFARYYAMTGRGIIKYCINKMSCVASMERFFAGFARRTGTTIDLEDTKRVIIYIKQNLVEDGLVTTARKIKHLFGRMEYVRYMQTLWAHPAAYLEHPRGACNNSFLMGAFACLGARIGALLPKKLKDDFPGIRYRDITISLERTSGSNWRVVYNLAQWYLKNHKDQENTLGAVNHEHQVPLLDDTQFLIACALADGAFAGIKTVEQFFNLKIPEHSDYLELPWDKEVQDLTIIRSVKDGRVSQQPLLAKGFESAMKKNLLRSGYLGTSKVQATVHAIRRALGKEIDERYTESQRAQLLGHSDPRVYGQSYVANTSAVDGKSAFLREPAQHKAINYFQSFERFYQPGLPTKLPADRRQQIPQHPEILALDKKIKSLEKAGAEYAQVQNKRRNTHTRIERKLLKDYQREWTDQQRLRQVSNPEDEYHIRKPGVEIYEAISRIFPEFDNLAKALTSMEPVNLGQRKQIIKDLVTAITRDYSIVYLPDENPCNGVCPNPKCSKSMESIHAERRSTHIHKCRKEQRADELGRSIAELQYCYLCFRWIVEEDWDAHCIVHLTSLSWQRCGALEFGNTVLRPAFCPFCLGNERLSPSKRMASWQRNRAIKDHLQAHLRGANWPQPCPLKSCRGVIPGIEGLQYHLKDEHELNVKISESLPLEHSSLSIFHHEANGGSGKRKRSSNEEQYPAVFPLPLDGYGVGEDVIPITISPTLLTYTENKIQDPLLQVTQPEDEFIQTISANHIIPQSPSLCQQEYDDEELFSEFIQPLPLIDNGESLDEGDTEDSRMAEMNTGDSLIDARARKRPRIILTFNRADSKPSVRETKAKKTQQKHQSKKRKFHQTVKSSKARQSLPKIKLKATIRPATRS